MDEDFELENKLKIYSVPIANKYTVYINDVKNPEYFNDLFFRLQNANEEDEFEIVINSFGGCESTAIQIYNEIKNCKAKVLANVSGYCCSAGTIILLACRGWKINLTSKIMVHSRFMGFSGKDHEIKQRSEFESVWVKDFFKTVYKGFLTDKEIEEVLNGKEFWLTGEETTRRLQKFSKQN